MGGQKGSWDMQAFFEKAASSYESATPMMKGIAQTVISLAPPITSASVVLDNACGPGIVTGEILEKLKSQGMATPEIHDVDLSPAMIRMVEKKGWKGVTAAVMDAQHLDFPDAKFTHSFMDFAIFALPDPAKAAAHIYRTLKPDGTAAVTTWKTLGWTRLFQKAIKTVRPNEPPWTGPMNPATMTGEWVRDLLEGAGFKAEDIKITNAEAGFSSADWRKGLTMMTDSMKPMMTQGWTEKEKEELEVELEKGYTEGEANPEWMEMIAWVAVARKQS